MTFKNEPQNSSKYSSQYTWNQIASQLRAIRLKKGWTLKEAELQSKGQFKSVVIGSYERGDRALTIERAIALADVYNVPFPSLLGIVKQPRYEMGRVVLDLRKLRATSTPDQLHLFVAWIIGARQDWNGEILTIRSQDLETLALMIGKSISNLQELLKPLQIVPLFK